jgi:hypothetical protein
LFHFMGGATQTFLAAGEERHSRTPSSEGVSYSPTNSRGGSGDHDDLAVSLHHRRLLLETGAKRGAEPPLGSTFLVPSRWARRDASAMIVSAGFALPWVGQTLPSAMKRLATAQV